MPHKKNYAKYLNPKNWLDWITQPLTKPTYQELKFLNYYGIVDESSSGKTYLVVPISFNHYVLHEEDLNPESVYTQAASAQEQLGKPHVIFTVQDVNVDLMNQFKQAAYAHMARVEREMDQS